MTTYPLVVQLIGEIAQSGSLTLSLFLVILGVHRRIFSAFDTFGQKIPFLR